MTTSDRTVNAREVIHHMTVLLAFALLFQATPDLLTLAECYRAAELEYPLRDQLEMLDEINRLTSQNVSAGYFPSMELGGQAVYFSDVAAFPGPNSLSASNDQYKATLSVEQAIYDGGVKAGQRSIADMQSAVERQRVTVKLFDLRAQVNRAFMGALLHDEQVETFESIRQVLDTRLATVRSQVENGLALRSAQDVLEVELLRNLQQLTEASANAQTMRNLLGILIGRPVDTQTILQAPSPSVETASLSKRTHPQHRVFDLSRKLLDSQAALVNRRKIPVVGAFAETAIGRPPGLDLFEDRVTPFYSLGIRMRWKPWDWRVAERETEIIDLQKRMIDVQEEAWTTNVALEAQNYLGQIESLKQLQSQDEEIIAIRARISDEAGARMEQGVLTATQYIVELQAETRARLLYSFHSLQLVQAQLNYLTAIGAEL